MFSRGVPQSSQIVNTLWHFVFGVRDLSEIPVLILEWWTQAGKYSICLFPIITVKLTINVLFFSLQVGCYFLPELGAPALPLFNLHAKPQWLTEPPITSHQCLYYLSYEEKRAPKSASSTAWKALAYVPQLCDHLLPSRKIYAYVSLRTNTCCVQLWYHKAVLQISFLV